MNKTLGYIVGGVAVVALIVGVMAFNKAPASVKGSAGSQGQQGVPGPQGPAGVAGRNGADAPIRLGAVTGPDTYFPYVGNNNVRVWTTQSKLIQASTTVCSLKGPNATTSLQASVSFRLASTSAVAVDLAISAQPAAATSTLLAVTRTLAASAQATILASTTGPIAPNTFVNVKMDGIGGNGLGNAPTGICQAAWTEI